MDADELFDRYRELQQYVAWTDDDTQRVRLLAPLLTGHFAALVDDFYTAVQRHPATSRFLTGGADAIRRLKRSLTDWLAELFSGTYDRRYVERRWQTGWRHAEIGLEWQYTSLALARLRAGLLLAMEQEWSGGAQEAMAIRRSLNKLIDVDAVLLEIAYQGEVQERAQAREREAERHRAESALDVSRRQLREERDFAERLLETAQTIVLTLDPLGRIVRFNSYMQELTGRRLEDVCGLDWFATFLPARDRARIRQLFDTLLTTGYIGAAVNPIVTAAGLEREIHWRSCLLRDDAGAVQGVLATGQDITDLKRAQERALQNERLAAIGQTMTGLVHESRNALQRSKACLEMLAVEVQHLPVAVDLVERALRAQDHLHKLYEEVRLYAAPIRLVRERCDLGAAWRETWQQLDAARDGKRLELREEVRGVDLHCRVDPFAIAQVWRNILENAIHASPQRSVVTVRATTTERDGLPAISVSFRDEGPGLSPEQQLRMFEPFFTTKVKGTGLGMAIALRIVEAHGGELAVGAGAAGGAEITVVLPRGEP